MTEEETLQKLNLLGIYDPHQLEEEDLGMWWHKKYLDIRDSQIKKETINEKLNAINQIVQELSKRKKWKLIEILSKSKNEKEEILKKLEILSISSSNQLEKNKLDFWWQKKYKEIKDSQLKEETIKEKLMEINEIYEELSKVDEKLLFEIINKESKEENIFDSDIDLYDLSLKLLNEKEYEKSIKKFSEDVIDRSVQENLHTLTALLNKIEQTIIKLRFGLNGDEPLELDEIARKFNFSIESVRQIEAEAISKLRKLNKFINNKKNLRNEKYYSDADFFELSCYLFENEEYEMSMNKILKAIKLNATEPEYFYLRGLHYIEFKNFDKALKDANNAIQLNDNEPKYLELKQDSLKFLTLKKIYEYFDNCEFEKTIVQCTKAISSNNPIPEFFYYRGLAKWKSNMVHQNKSILNDFDNAITLDPDNLEILTTRGILKMEIDYNGDQIKSAIKDFNLAIEFDDKCIDAYAQRAKARLLDNNCEGAFDDINSVMRLDPHNKYNYFDELKELKTDIEKKEKELLGDWGYIYLIENITSTYGTHKIGATQNIRSLKRNLKGDKLKVCILCKNYLKMEDRYKSLYRKERMKNANNYNLEDIHVKNIIHSMHKLSITYSGEYTFTKRKDINKIIYPSSWS